MTWGDVGEWLIGGTAPWWAAILTFFLGQLYSLKGAREQRQSDSADRAEERQHALALVGAERQAALERQNADHAAAAALADADAWRARKQEEREQWNGTVTRAVIATASLRAEVAKSGGNRQEIGIDSVREFMAASSSISMLVGELRSKTELIQQEVQTFMASNPFGQAAPAGVLALDESLAEYASDASRYPYWDPDED